MSLYPLKSSLPQALNALYPCWVTSLQANICKAELMTFQLQARQTHLLCKHVFNCPPECSLYTNSTSMTDSRNRELYIDSDSHYQLSDFPTCHMNSSSVSPKQHILIEQPGIYLTDQTQLLSFSLNLSFSSQGGIGWDCTAVECPPLAHWE